MREDMRVSLGGFHFGELQISVGNIAGIPEEKIVLKSKMAVALADG
jgi:hypothetical protein